MEQILHTPSAELAVIASKVLMTEAIPLGELSVEKIGHSVGQATVGIYRVVGRAQTATGEQAWSAVAKVLGTPAIAVSGMNPGTQRELEVYRSGVFATPRGGLRAAHCYVIQERNDMQLMWLEDLSQAQQPPWPAEQFAETAYHLGRFNAHWPEAEPPQWRWLNPTSFRQFFERQPFQGFLERLSKPQGNRQITQVMPPDIVAETVRFWEEREWLLTHVEATPKGICHLDCHPRNLFPMRDATSQRYIVAIDWAEVGVGVYGIDLGHLLLDPIRQQTVPSTEVTSFAERCFTAYTAGLHAAGWSGNVAQVKFAFLARLACESFRNISVAIMSIENPQIREVAAKIENVSFAEISKRRTQAQRHYLHFKEQAYQLFNET